MTEGPLGMRSAMSGSQDKEAASDLWRQTFARMAASEHATLVRPEYDRAEAEARLRSSYAEAGWSTAEIEERIAVERAAIASAPVTSPGVELSAELILDAICRDIESAMTRLGLDSHLRVARGIEPLVDRLPSMTNVVMTDQGIVTVGSFFFRFCGLIARGFARTLHLNPWLWEHEDYSNFEARRTIIPNRDIVSFECADVDEWHAPVLIDGLERPLGAALQAELFDGPMTKRSKGELIVSATRGGSHCWRSERQESVLRTARAG
jgi:hypothetical protein